MNAGVSSRMEEETETGMETGMEKGKDSASATLSNVACGLGVERLRVRG
jgi:hypothetical protein